MSDKNADEIVGKVREHAEKIMAAAGSSLRHYETTSKAEILAAVMDCYEEAYRAGSEFTASFITSKKEQDDGE